MDRTQNVRQPFENRKTAASPADNYPRTRVRITDASSHDILDFSDRILDRVSRMHQARVWQTSRSRACNSSPWRKIAERRTCCLKTWLWQDAANLGRDFSSRQLASPRTAPYSRILAVGAQALLPAEHRRADFRVCSTERHECVLSGRNSGISGEVSRGLICSILMGMIQIQVLPKASHHDTPLH